jgi:hypothetical protein
MYFQWDRLNYVSFSSTEKCGGRQKMDTWEKIYHYLAIFYILLQYPEGSKVKHLFANGENPFAYYGVPITER